MKYLLVISTVVVMIFGVTEAQNNVCQGFPNGYNVDNPVNCRAFWTCQNGIPWDNECDIGYKFNQAEQSCDSPQNHQCVDVELPTTLEPTTEADEATTDAGEDTTIGLNTPLPPIDIPDTDEDVTYPDNGLPFLCVGRPNGFLINNPANCRAFYVCIGEIAGIGECPPNFSFNEAQQMCDSQYSCTDDIVDGLCPIDGIHAFERVNSCNEFNFCFGGFHSIRRCADGLHFNSVEKRCDFPDQAVCLRERCPEFNDPQNIITYSSESSCEEFYICYSGQMRSFRCAPGLFWDQRTQNCEKPHNSDCHISEIPLPGAPIVDPAVECPREPGLHIIAHSTDCSKYYVCSFNTPVLTKCLDGMLFDNTLKGCNIAERVACSTA